MGMVVVGLQQSAAHHRRDLPWRDREVCDSGDNGDSNRHVGQLIAAEGSLCFTVLLLYVFVLTRYRRYHSPLGHGGVETVIVLIAA